MGIIYPGDDTRCHSHGDGIHEYGRCTLEQGHDEPHEDQEGYVWEW